MPRLLCVPIPMSPTSAVSASVAGHPRVSPLVSAISTSVPQQSAASPTVSQGTLSGVCHPSIETSPGTQLIEHQAGDQRWLRITWNGDLLLGRCHADCVFQHNIVEFALVKRLNNKSKVMIGIYIVFVWKLFKIDQITQIKQKLNFHQCTMCCL